MKNKKKLIIFLPKFVFSGAGNSVFSIINYLNKYNFDLHIICLGKCDYKKKFNKKVQLYEINKQSLFASIPQIYSTIKKINFNSKKTIIYSNHHYANVYSILFKLLFKNIYVVGVERTCIHELSSYFSLKDFIKKKLLKILVLNLYSHANYIVTNTLYTKKEILNFSKKNVKHIYPPSIKLVKPFKKKKINKKINILWVGRLHREKGIEDLINSVKYLNFEANIYVLGDGNEYSKIKNLIKKKNNKKIKIYLKKYVKNTLNYFLKSHILVNTSYFEGSNNSIIEAINNNLLVLASRTPGGNIELLNNNSFGLLYKKNNSIDLARKLNSLILKYDSFQLKIKNNKKNLNKFLSDFSNKKTSIILNKI